MNQEKIKKLRLKRTLRVRNAVTVSADRPRLLVVKSCKHIYAQIINEEGQTLASVGSYAKGLRSDGKHYFCNKEMAAKIGKAVGEKAKELGISKVAFDRNGYMYHGRVKVLADACRETGIEF